MTKNKAKTSRNKKSNSLKKSKKHGLNMPDFKKSWKKLSYLGLAGFLAVSSIGYGVWKTYEQVDVNAAGYKRLTGMYNDAVQITACRIGYSGARWRLVNNTSSFGMYFSHNGATPSMVPGFSTRTVSRTGLSSSTYVYGTITNRDNNNQTSSGGITLSLLPVCP